MYFVIMLSAIGHKFDILTVADLAFGAIYALDCEVCEGTCKFAY